MIILYSIIITLLLIIIGLIYYLIRLRDDNLNNSENDLIVFVLTMYLEYGESLDIFPSEDAKQIILDRINQLKTKLTNKNKKNAV